MIEIFLLFTTFLFFFFSAHLWQENQELRKKLTKDETKLPEEFPKEKDVYSMKKISNENLPPKSSESLKKRISKYSKSNRKKYTKRKYTTKNLHNS